MLPEALKSPVLKWNVLNQRTNTAINYNGRLILNLFNFYLWRMNVVTFSLTFSYRVRSVQVRSGQSGQVRSGQSGQVRSALVGPGQVRQVSVFRLETHRRESMGFSAAESSTDISPGCTTPAAFLAKGLALGHVGCFERL